MPSPNSGLVTRNIPSVIGGVSQLPATERHPSQCSELINLLPSLTRGLVKRPRTSYLTDLSTFGNDGVFSYAYKRDNSEKYLVLIEDGDLKVIDLADGSEKTVTIESGAEAYLASNNPKRDFRAVTVGDVTFILNRDIETAIDEETLSPAAANECLVWVRLGDYATKYEIKLTQGGVDNTCQYFTDYTNRAGIDTSLIAGALYSQLERGEDSAYVTLAGPFEIGDTITITETVSSPDVVVDYVVKASITDPTVAESLFDIMIGIAAAWNGTSTLGRDEVNGVLAVPFPAYSGFLNINADGRVHFVARNPANSWTYTATTDSVAGTVTPTNGTNTDDGYEAELKGSVIRIYRNDTTPFTIRSRDGLGDQGIEVIKSEIQRFEDLPLKGSNGFKVEVTGDNLNADDNYWVVYEESDVLESGVWRETLAPAETVNLDPSTMPHILTRDDDGTFTFSVAPWEPRKVGDLDTNPFPSFIGNKISDIFIHRGRLGLVSLDTVVLSQAGDYFDLFRKSVGQLLDEDIIDVASPHVSGIRHALSHDKNLILWNDLGQASLTGEPLLTAKSASIDPLTAFEASADVKPVPIGKFAYFPSDRGQSVKIYEFFTSTLSEDKRDADDLTLRVPSYIQGDPTGLTSSSNAGLLVVEADADPSQLFVCAQAWRGEGSDRRQKILNAWFKWSFGSDLLSVSALDNQLLLIMDRDGTTTIEILDVGSEPVDEFMSAQVALDCIMDDETTGVSSAYDSMDIHTTWTLPFALDDNDFPNLTILKKATESEALTPYVGAITRPAANQIRVSGGDFTNDAVWIGLTWEFVWEWSTIFLTSDEQDGSATAITDGRLQLRYANINFDHTGHFNVEVLPETKNHSGDPYVYEYDGASDDEKGKLRFPILSDNTKVTITVTDDTYRPCSFQSVNWDGYLSEITKRV